MVSVERTATASRHTTVVTVIIRGRSRDNYFSHTIRHSNSTDRGSNRHTFTLATPFTDIVEAA